jgi:hypothetical protein
MHTMIRETKNAIQLYFDRMKYSHAYTKPHSNLDFDTHIKEAAAWLCRAQDAPGDRGVSYGAQFKEGFLESYPETTGYIIPTFLRLADSLGDPAYLDRAIEMADWEISIQMESGAVMGGRVSEKPTPAVFNTGQVLIGWAALYKKTSERRYSEASSKSANWLLGIQEADGSWRRFNSRYANPTATTYNVKAAWGLCLFGVESREQRYVDSALRNADFAISQQTSNGWFRNCCLTDPEKPLLHTIAYAMQGLLEIGMLTGREHLIAAARKTADSLSDIMREDGFLPGRIKSDFSTDTEWCCLTGSAQSSIVFSRLAKLSGEQRYKDAARRLNLYLMSRHDISSKLDTIRGGLCGSWPVYGDYGRFMILNWATKFLIDALMEGREFGV